MLALTQVLISGLAVGTVYGLVALGFVILFKATDVFNFAQGTYLLIGAYLAITASSDLHIPLPLMAIIVTVATASVGLLSYQLLVRRMARHSLLAIVMLTIGLTLVLGGGLNFAYGPANYNLDTPLANRALFVGPLYVNLPLLAVSSVALVAMAGFAVFFRLSRIGLLMRATAENHEAAVVVGINVGFVHGLAWALSAGLAGIAGILLANVDSVGPGLSSIALLSFPAAVIGGLRSVPGAIVGGVLVGVLQMLGGAYVSSQAGDIIVYAALVIVLIVRPFGLLGRPEVTRV